MTHVNNSAVTRDTDDVVTIDGVERPLIVALTPEGLMMRPKGMSKSRAVTYEYARIWNNPPAKEVDFDEGDWDRGYAQGQADLKDYVKGKLKREGSK